MKKPTSVSVFGQKYKIKSVPGLDRQGFIGQCDPLKKLITIDSSLKGDSYWECLLHEMFHAVCRELSVHQAISLELEEIIVDNFAKALVRNLKIALK